MDSNGSNFRSNASNFRSNASIWHSNGSNLHSNASNWHFNGSNLRLKASNWHSNGSLEWFEFGFKLAVWFESPLQVAHAKVWSRTQILLKFGGGLGTRLARATRELLWCPDPTQLTQGEGQSWS